MKHKYLVLVGILALAGLASPARAMSYSFVQGNWENVDPDQGDSGNGAMLNGSYGMNDVVHLVGSYEDVSFDYADLTVWQVGGGLHRTMQQDFDLFAEATFVDAKVDVPLVGSESDNGYSLCGGARKQLTPAWEINGAIEVIDAGPIDDTVLGFGALYSLQERYALSAGYKLGDVNTFTFGFRWSFGR